MARSVGTISINLNAGTAQFIVDMEKANAKVTQFGKFAREASGHGVSGVQAVSGALRVLEGGITNNLRAAERFTANVLGLGPLLQAAFPVVGAIAFLGVLGKVGEEGAKFFKEMRDAPESLRGAWRQLGGSMVQTNDDTRVSIERVNLEIAKLEGKRENTLNLMLVEAKASADRLTTSLSNSFKELSKLLDEHKPGFLDQLLGVKSTIDVRMMAGGYTGTAGIQEKLDKAAKEGDLAIAQATNKKALAAAETAKDVALQKILNAELADSNRLLNTYVTYRDELSPTGQGIEQIKPGEERNVAGMRDYIATLKANSERINLDAQLRTATRRKETDEAGRDKARLDRPLDNKLAELDAQITAAKLKLNAAGLSEAEKVIAKTEGDALEAIRMVNKELDHRVAGSKVDPAGEAAIRSKVAKLDSLQAEEQWKAKLAQTTATIHDQVRGQETLTDAIGKGYEMVKKANVEVSVMREVGPERYEDFLKTGAKAADVLAVRASAEASYEAKHREEMAQTGESLKQEITLETRLAQVQTQGAAAVRLATLQQTLAVMSLNGATKELLDLTVKKFNAEELNRSAGEVAKINEQISGIRRVTAARIEGIEAVRKAELENKYEQIRKQGGQLMPGAAGMSGITVAENAERTKDIAEHQDKITQSVVGRLQPFEKELQDLKEEEALLLTMEAAYGRTADIERALRDIEDARLKIAVQQTLQLKTAQAGVRAFFLEMQEQAKSAAQIMYDALNSTLDKTSDNLAKLLTGQKTNWRSEFKSVGEGMVKDSTKGLIGMGLGALGKAFPALSGITSSISKSTGAKMDGQNQATALWVRISGQASGPGSGSNSKSPQFPGNGGLLGTGQVPRSDTGADSADSSNGLGRDIASDIGSGIGSSTSKSQVLPNILEKVGGTLTAKANADLMNNLFPARASGGDVTPGMDYLVGERGPELFRSGSAGRIVNSADTRRALSGGGDTHNYTIDARGTDPVLTGQRVEAALRAVHGSAITTSARLHHDAARRTPAHR